MAIKAYCDICESELEKDPMAGATVAIAETSYFKKEKGIQRTELLFCDTCTYLLKEKINQIKDERKKVREV